MKVFEGIVRSNNMKNTVVVEVFRVTPHPLYRKLVKLSKKYKVDTQGMEEISVGSVVRITETKPISKGKYFKVTKIVSKGENKLSLENEKKVKEVLDRTEKPEVKKVDKVVKSSKGKKEAK